MNSSEIREKFLGFFAQKSHAIVPSASLIPENDPTVLFTTAGMHPLVPFLLGQPHPKGKRLVNFQKCLRTDDVEEVGDKSHNTFFEMLGNWSLGDYFKKESIAWSFEFLTGAEWLNISPLNLYVTVFEGDEDVPLDEESIKIWQEEFQKKGIEAKIGERIFLYGKKQNWWGMSLGPCGPDSEIFYDTGVPHNEKFGEKCHPNCDCGRFVEIWNNVFMEYDKVKNGEKVVLKPLFQKNIDTGMGLERITMIKQNALSVYETDLFLPLIKKIEELSGGQYQSKEKSFRIIADHIRAAAFILADGGNIVPSNVERGYVLRKLIRRAIRHGRLLGAADNFLSGVAGQVVENFKDVYPELLTRRERIFNELIKEEEKFKKTLDKGIKKFYSIKAKIDAENGNFKTIGAEDAFFLYETYGFPPEMVKELAEENGLLVDERGFEKAYKNHQLVSRKGAQQKFKGGLADASEMSAKYHTATHLLQAALRQIISSDIVQAGSNINSERLRFDFSFGRKLTEEEIKKIEGLVNEKIKENLSVEKELMSYEDAKNKGVLGIFADKYGDKVYVYTILNKETGEIFSKEICGGPHAQNTGVLGFFKIAKEESSSAGVRRIKAVLE